MARLFLDVCVEEGNVVHTMETSDFYVKETVKEFSGLLLMSRENTNNMGRNSLKFIPVSQTCREMSLKRRLKLQTDELANDWSDMMSYFFEKTDSTMRNASPLSGFIASQISQKFQNMENFDNIDEFRALDKDKINEFGAVLGTYMNQDIDLQSNLMLINSLFKGCIDQYQTLSMN
jgi:hypothetical protein